jgi:hypothetical protein
MKKSLLFIALSVFIILFISSVNAFSQMPAAISIEPENATVYDEITLTFDPVEACFQSGSLAGLPSIGMHSGVTINGSTWQNVIAFNATGANGQSPILTANPDGTFSIIYTPYDFYGFAVGANVTQICAVFNNGTDWTQDGRDFQSGGTNCMDFFIPIQSGTPVIPGITSIVPNEAEQGESLNVNIFGINTHFQNTGTTAWISLLSDSLGFQSIYAVNDTLISAQLEVPSDAVTGFWDVNVVNPEDGLMTLSGGFQITDTITVYPFSITIYPPNATAYDEITLTLDAKLSCPEASLFDADSVMMHSGVTIGGTAWMNVVNFDGIGANGQSPKLTYNGDTTWSIVFTPLEFYGVTTGTYVEAINCVFNGGDWAAGEGKNYDTVGNCIDFIIPLGYATGIETDQQKTVQLYPNPATDKINIKSSSQLKSIVVINYQGIEVLCNRKLHDCSNQVDISNLPGGIYLLVSEDSEGFITASKFSKN